ncbi:hypothetical protein N2152v2_003058 [Parachlorella kessleri]
MEVVKEFRETSRGPRGRPDGRRRRTHVARCKAADTETAYAAPPSAKQLRLSVGGREITLETGEIGRQASGAVMATDGETMVYTTACADSDTSGDGSFAPLQVHYFERFSAAGRTSGGYLKREGRAKDHEVLVARLIDRPLRPMIQPGWTHSTQVLSWVLSYDGEHATEPLAVTAAGAALALSDVPLKRVVAGVRVGMLPDLGFVVNPTVQQLESSSLDLMLAGTSEAVLMIEGFCDFLTEEQLLEAVATGHAAIADMCRAIDTWAAEVGRPKRTGDLLLPPPGLDQQIMEMIGAELESCYRNSGSKQERGEATESLKERVRAALTPSLEETAAAAAAAAVGAGSGNGAAPRYDSTTVSMALKRVESAVMRGLVLREGFRADGRGVADVRPIWSRAQVLPRTHGSVLFTRGETQALAVTTLGCRESIQKVDSMAGAEEREGQRFYLQYSFPPSSVGETGRMGPPGRREVGHGNLAERALAPVVPPESDFPYTIRVESTITESNGSSSMASVCGGCLSMLDAGVPVRRMVAGVAMGLILEQDGRFQVLTDILGSEDALGDMDFKVAGDDSGITAFQMDIKVEGITLPIMAKALEQAREGRRHILAEMAKCSPPPRGLLSRHAPRILRVAIPQDKVGLVIGPGGKTIRGVQEATGAELQIDSTTGEVYIKSTSEEALERAAGMLDSIIADPVVGQIYRQVPVTQVFPFGVLVEVFHKREGLLHVSEWDVTRTPNIADVAKEGDLLDVMVIELGEQGRYKLSRKAVLRADGLVPADFEDTAGSDADGRPDRGDRNGGRRGDRRGRGDRNGGKFRGRPEREQAAVSEAAVSEAAVSEAAVSEAAVSEAQESLG